MSRLARRAVLKMAINKVKYGEYMISLLRSHTQDPGAQWACPGAVGVGRWAARTVSERANCGKSEVKDGNKTTQ